MELTVIGCSGSLPGPASPASCYLAEADGFRLLLDLGSGALGSLQAVVPLDGIDAICLSHLHADHCLDMCSYEVARTYHPAGRMPKIPVYGPAGTAERLARAAAVADNRETGMLAAFDFVTLLPGQIEIGPFRVTAARMNHPVQTHGFRLEHGGRAVAYSADTGPTDELVRLSRQADVLLSEATFTTMPGLPPDLHLTAAQAAEHAARAEVAELVLTHIPPWQDPEQSLAEAAAGYSGPIRLAATGLRL